MHKALDKSRAVLGPLVAYALLKWLGESASTFSLLFLVAVVLVVLGVLVLMLIHRPPGQPLPRESLRQKWQQLRPGFKHFLLPTGVFALAYFSLGFFLLRAHGVGFSLTDVVLLYALFNITCVVAAPLVGHLGDRVGRSRIVLLGYATYASLNLWMVFASTRWEMIAVFCIYGVFYAIEESQSKAFIADIEPERRATAIGAYNFVTGSLYLPASLVAGALWTFAPSMAFALATALSLVAMVVFVRVRPAAGAAH